MKIARTLPDGFWPTPDTQRGWWQGIYFRLGRFHLKLHWHREASNTGSGGDS